VVVSARCMIDELSSAAGSASFQSCELYTQPVVVEKFDSTGVHEWQELEIYLAFRFLRWLVCDPALCKLFARPLTRVAIAVQRTNAITPQRLRKFVDHSFR